MMVVDKIQKAIFVMTLLLLFSAKLAADELIKPTTPLQKQILDLSYQQMNSAFDALENKTEECQRQEAKVVLSPAIFNTINLSLEQWKTALLYFGFNTFHQCESESLWGKAIIALNRFKMAEKKYHGRNNRKTRYKQGNFCCAIWERKLKLELTYLDIPEEYRLQLESIAELQRPFNVLKTIDAVELWLK